MAAGHIIAGLDIGSTTIRLAIGQMVGEGDGQISQIIKELTSERDYHGFLSLEPHLGNFAGFAALENIEEGEVEELEQSDAGKFGIAVDALKTILSTQNIAHA